MFRFYTKTILAYTAIFLVAALLLAACTMPIATPAPAAQAEPSPTIEATAEATTEPSEETTVRLYTDAMGRGVEIPVAPQRIVAHYYAPEMVALGIPIISTNYNNAALILTEAQIAGIEETGTEGIEPNMEKILTLDPDLIIMPDFLEASVLDELSQIAPTIAVAYNDPPFTHLRTLADIVGKPELAEEWIESYTAKVEEKRAEVAPFMTPGETASAFIITVDKRFFVYGPQRLGPTMYDALGFTMPPKVAELFEGNDELWQQISLELLPEYVGDRIFVVTSNEAEAEAYTDEIINSALWQSIPAVQNGKAYIVPTRWAFNDPLTLDWLLDEMTKVLMQP